MLTARLLTCKVAYSESLWDSLATRIVFVDNNDNAKLVNVEYKFPKGVTCNNEAFNNRQYDKYNLSV